MHINQARHLFLKDMLYKIMLYYGKTNVFSDET